MIRLGPLAFPLAELPRPTLLGSRNSTRGPEVAEGGVEGKLSDDGVGRSSCTKLGDAMEELGPINWSGYT